MGGVGGEKEAELGVTEQPEWGGGMHVPHEHATCCPINFSMVPNRSSQSERLDLLNLAAAPSSQ
jgi:hypothetical protein